MFPSTVSDCNSFTHIELTQTKIVDAASGGFVAPFVVPDLEWDFRLKKVVSINTSGHKYGLVSSTIVKYPEISANN